MPDESPSKTMVVHLGFQKTGTTTIQAMINANAAKVPYVDVRAYGEATKDLRVSGRNFCAEMSGTNEARLRCAVAKHFESFRANDLPFCLISDENIIGRVAYSESGHVLSWAKRIIPIIEEYSEGTTLRFVFYTRDSVKWLHSLYKQSVKRARVTSSYPVWALRMPVQVDWEQWHHEMQSVSRSPVDYIKMEDELNEGKVLGSELLYRVGITDSMISSFACPKAQNTSLSDFALATIRLINRMPLDDRRVLKISEAIERVERRMYRQ